MSTRKTTLFYGILIATASLFVGMVIASRLDLSPSSSAQTIAVPPMNSAPLTGPIDASTFRNIAKAATPMVVNIRTEMKTKTQDLTDFFGGGGAPDDLFHRFFGNPGDDTPQQGGRGRGQGQGQNRQREQTTRAAGTGFIISKDGFILTNNHVVEDATKIEVALFGDDDADISYTAKVVGRDPLTDSALIQLVDKPNHPLVEAKFGDSSQIAAGDWVMAIGNPFGWEHTVTVGVISATSRAFHVTDGRTNDMLQTDAAINPGNSGGPLLNVRARGQGHARPHRRIGGGHPA
ncbi:MAG: trypsin-like peptidase domain-containing protein [Acidobacteria bacterium]|nr:trypsin-like peptidase domain-containing protein [Acidobacteriota bacterium]